MILPPRKLFSLGSKSLRRVALLLVRVILPTIYCPN